MDNAVQIDLHTASVVLRARSFNSTIPICLLHSAYNRREQASQPRGCSHCAP